MNRKRIAVLFYEDLSTQRGMFNAVRNRIKNLVDTGEFEVEVFLISKYEPCYVRFLRKTPKVNKVNIAKFDDIDYHVFWYTYSLIDYVLSVKFHKKPLFRKCFFKRLTSRIRGFDAISSHSLECGEIAYDIGKRDEIPFFVTWHGSDIHTIPFGGVSVFEETKRILKNATCNFFVSQSLQAKGKEICPEMKSMVLYNGVGNTFYRFDGVERLKLRDKFQLIEKEKVVAYVGHFIEVKNPRLLPLIFEAVNNKYDSSPVKFWAIGSGKEESFVIQECRKRNLPLVFWGSQNPDDMPQFMNCIDVLVLPSRNEGLPLVTVEAIACGANAVGSDVGGTKEAVGEDNVFPHGDDFVDRISDRIVYMLSHNVDQPLKEIFHWACTAEKECEVYKDALEDK